MRKRIIIAAAFLLLTAPAFAWQDHDYAAAAEKVRVRDVPPLIIPDPPMPKDQKPDPEKEKEKQKAKEKEKEEQKTWHDHVKELAARKEFWRDGFERIDRRLGLFTDKVTIDVSLQMGQMISVARSTYTHSSLTGGISFNTTSMKSQGDRMIETMLIAHLTKIVVSYHFNEMGLAANKKADLPEWFTEGLALVIGYPDWPIANRKLRVQKMSDFFKGEEASARGRLFFEYVDSQGGGRLKEWVRATVIEGQSFKEASEAVFKIEWNKFLDAERKWSENRVSKK